MGSTPSAAMYVFGPAEEGRDDRLADGGARTPSSRGLRSPMSGFSRTRGTPGRPSSPGPGTAARCGRRGRVNVVLCYSSDRLARKFAYQALLIEEFTRAGMRVEFIKGPRGDSAEDQLLVHIQGMFAEYEKAQILERYRRGKAHRAKAGSVNVLGGAPFGYRYVRKTERAGAVYEIVEHEAELFRRYADEGASIADLARWSTEQGMPTRTGKHRGPQRDLGDAAQPPPMPAARCSARPWSCMNLLG